MALQALIPFIPAIGQGLMGLGQTIFGGLGAAKARRAAERDIAGRRPDEGIMNYYRQALARYSPDPYRSMYYQEQQRQAGRGLATGISAAQTRRGGLGAIGGLTQQYMDASARAGAQAEQMGRQDLAQLGSAARVAAAEKQRIEDMKTNLLMQKWAQKAQLMNQGMQNIYGAGSTAAYMTGGGEDNQVSSDVRRGMRQAKRYQKRYNPQTWADWQSMETD